MLCPEYLEPHAAIRRWMERVESVGHGTSETMSSAEALAACAAAERVKPTVTVAAARLRRDWPTWLRRTRSERDLRREVA